MNRGPCCARKTLLSAIATSVSSLDDDFLSSHGVATPDAFWKVIIRGTDRVMAWLIPNTKDATRTHLDRYLVSIEELERHTGETFPEVPAFARSEKPEASWLIPQGCNRK